MTERRSRRRKRESDSEDEENGANEEQTEVAKYLRFNCETKSSNFKSQKVEYFKGAKAINCLLDSKWASGKGETEILFTDRESVQGYLQETQRSIVFCVKNNVPCACLFVLSIDKTGCRKKTAINLLDLGMFKRITRVRKKKKGEKDEGKKGTKDSKDSPKPGKTKKDSNEGKNEDSEGKKIKVKVKLEIHEFQEFLDGEEVYMWIFDPVHPRTIIYGVLVVIGAIVICLFPLWPAQMREYTWYLSVGAAVLLGALLVVALFRYVLFGFVWAITIGRHHFWLFPNLTEDCGFLESFVPLYTHSSVETKEDDKTEDDKTGDDKDGDKETSEDKQERGDEDGKTKANVDEEAEDSACTLEQKPARKSSATTNKETNESESWINVTDEDIAQAKEATGNKTDTKTMTSPVNC